LKRGLAQRIQVTQMANRDPPFWMTWVKITSGPHRLDERNMLNTVRSALARIEAVNPDDKDVLGRVSTAFESLLLAVFPPDGRDT
jgi:hypothetical protein